MMKLKHLGSFGTLQAQVRACRVTGVWQSRDNGADRRFKTESGEILDWWKSTGTIRFQGRANGLLQKRFIANRRAASKKCPRVAHRGAAMTVNAFSDLKEPHLSTPIPPADFMHPYQETRLKNVNKRASRIADLFAAMSNEATAGELIFAAVRYALISASEADVHRVLCTVARELMSVPIGVEFYNRVDYILSSMSDLEA